MKRKFRPGKKITDLFTEGLWRIDTASCSKGYAKLVRLVRIIRITIDSFFGNKMGFQCVALSYFSLLALIPLFGLVFAVALGLGLPDNISGIIFRIFPANPEFAGLVIEKAEVILESVKAGGTGIISAFLFVWGVVWMMFQVERVFNNVWGVRKPERPFFKSLGVDIVILILSPFVILILYSGTIVYSHILDLFPKWMGVSDAISSLLGWVIAAAVTVMIFSAMYKFIPAAKVEYRYALKSAMLAGVAFTILQYLYLETQVMVMRQNAVYGTIAAIPLFMMWLRYGWLIILLGAQISYSFQTVDGLETDNEIEDAIKNHKQVEEI